MFHCYIEERKGRLAGVVQPMGAFGVSPNDRAEDLGTAADIAKSHAQAFEAQSASEAVNVVNYLQRARKLEAAAQAAAMQGDQAMLARVKLELQALAGESAAAAAQAHAASAAANKALRIGIELQTAAAASRRGDRATASNRIAQAKRLYEAIELTGGKDAATGTARRRQERDARAMGLGGLGAVDAQTAAEDAVKKAAEKFCVGTGIVECGASVFEGIFGSPYTVSDSTGPSADKCAFCAAIVAGSWIVAKNMGMLRVANIFGIREEALRGVYASVYNVQPDEAVFAQLHEAFLGGELKWVESATTLATKLREDPAKWSPNRAALAAENAAKAKAAAEAARVDRFNDYSSRIARARTVAAVDTVMRSISNDTIIDASQKALLHSQGENRRDRLAVEGNRGGGTTGGPAKKPESSGGGGMILAAVAAGAAALLLAGG